METVRWRDGDMPAYRGNAIVIEELDRGRAPDVCVINGVDVGGMRHGIRWLWDGKSWRGGYRPFCTLRCALDYARAAYRADLEAEARANNPHAYEEQ